MIAVTIGDHPRGCGENFAVSGFLPRQMGSPPRMRGKLNQAVAVFCFAGITPADAGKTYAGRYSTYRSQDHPRGCGENIKARVRRHRYTGSPPRMRGKPWYALADRQRQRITPAGAGKTSGSRTRTNCRKDHPRRCGENYLPGFGFSFPLGSPPQVRGKHCEANNYTDDCRITPAGAGKTSHLPGCASTA